MKRTIAALAATGALAVGIIAAPPAVAGTSDYVAFVREQTGMNTASSTLIPLGKTICKALKVGVPVGRVVQTGFESGLDAEEVAAVVVGAAVFICPAQLPKVERWIDS